MDEPVLYGAAHLSAKDTHRPLSRLRERGGVRARVISDSGAWSMFRRNRGFAMLGFHPNLPRRLVSGLALAFGFSITAYVSRLDDPLIEP